MILKNRQQEQGGGPAALGRYMGLGTLALPCAENSLFFQVSLFQNPLMDAVRYALYRTPVVAYGAHPPQSMAHTCRNSYRTPAAAYTARPPQGVWVLWIKKADY
jgi:hypothetical protein